MVKVTLTDVNDNHPQFSPQNYSVNVDLSEAVVGTTIVRVQAQDPDSGTAGSIQYSITGGNDRGYFSIITSSGMNTYLMLYSLLCEWLPGAVINHVLLIVLSRSY